MLKRKIDKRRLVINTSNLPGLQPNLLSLAVDKLEEHLDGGDVVHLAEAA
jgi:hypothetical protein